MIKEKAIETLQIEAAQLLKSGQTVDAVALKATEQLTRSTSQQP